MKIQKCRPGLSPSQLHDLFYTVKLLSTHYRHGFHYCTQILIDATTLFFFFSKMFIYHKHLSYSWIKLTTCPMCSFVGPEPTLFGKPKFCCMRLHYNNGETSGYFHTLRALTRNPEDDGKGMGRLFISLNCQYKTSRPWIKPGRLEAHCPYI